MPVTYRPSRIGSVLAGLIFLMVLLLGVYSKFYWFFFLWGFILFVFGGDYYYETRLNNRKPKKLETDKDVAETVELLNTDKLKF